MNSGGGPKVSPQGKLRVSGHTWDRTRRSARIRRANPRQSSMTRNVPWAPAATNGRIGASLRSARRMYPVRPSKTIRLRSRQGRITSTSPPGYTSTLWPDSKIRRPFSALARTAPSIVRNGVQARKADDQLVTQPVRHFLDAALPDQRRPEQERIRGDESAAVVAHVQGPACRNPVQAPDLCPEVGEGDGVHEVGQRHHERLVAVVQGIDVLPGLHPMFLARIPA